MGFNQLENGNDLCISLTTDLELMLERERYGDFFGGDVDAEKKYEELYELEEQAFDFLDDTKKHGNFDQAGMDKAEAFYYELQDIYRDPTNHQHIHYDHDRGIYGIYDNQEYKKIREFEAMFDDTVQTLEPALKDFCERNHLEYAEGSVAESLKYQEAIKICELNKEENVDLVLEPHFDDDCDDGICFELTIDANADGYKTFNLDEYEVQDQLDEIGYSGNKNLKANGTKMLYLDDDCGFQSPSQLAQALDKDIIKDFIEETKKNLSQSVEKDY